MTALDRKRVAALELRYRHKAPLGLTEAATRLQNALSEALPPIPYMESRRISEWCVLAVPIPGGMSFEERLAELAGRIAAGTTNAGDAAVFASLDKGDLETVGQQSAQDYIVRLSALMAMF